MFVGSRSCKTSCIRLPLEQNYDTCDDSIAKTESQLVGRQPNPNGYSYGPTASEIFSRYLIAIPLCRQDDMTLPLYSAQCFRSLSNTLTRLSRSSMKRKRFYFIGHERTDASIRNQDGPSNTGTTLGMIERFHQVLKPTLEVNTTADTLHWDPKSNSAVMADKTTQQIDIRRTDWNFSRTHSTRRGSHRTQESKTTSSYQNGLQDIDRRSLPEKREHVRYFRNLFQEKTFCEWGAHVQPLKVGNYAFQLQLVLFLGSRLYVGMNKNVQFHVKPSTRKKHTLKRSCATVNIK